MFTLYVFSAVIGGGMVLASLLSSIGGHHDGDHGQDGGAGGHGGHDGHEHGGLDHAGHDHAAHDGQGHDGHAPGHASGNAQHDAEAPGAEAASEEEADAVDEPAGTDVHGAPADAHGPASGGAPASHGAGAIVRQGGPQVLSHTHDAQSPGDLGYLGFLRFVRPTSHFLTGFGTTGLLVHAAGMLDPIGAATAAATGALTMFVGSRIARLRTHETTSAIGEDDLLGCPAEVLYRVGPGEALGRVRVPVKGSAPDFSAVPARPELTLEAGEKVFVVSQRDDGVVRVDRTL